MANTLQIDLEKLKTVENSSLRVELISDDIIVANRLKQVTNPVSFNRDIPTPDGLFSNEIFGMTKKERSKTLAYIDLNCKIFHPYAWEVLLRLNGNFNKVAKGEGEWKIENGELIKVSDEVNWSQDSTGLQWLVENFDKLDFNKSDSKSYIRSERVNFIEGCKAKKCLFITKWAVIPVIYRDVEHSSTGSIKKNEISQLYENVLRYTNALAKDTIGIVNTNQIYAIEIALVKLRKHGQSLIHKKNGFFHKSILGKTQIYGSRSVISAPVMRGVEKPSDNPVNMDHTGIPLAQCISNGYPFIAKWVNDFFRKYFETRGENNYTYKYNPETRRTELVREDIDYEAGREMYNTDYIDKMMKRYIKFYESRFYPIEVPLKNGEMTYMNFTGNITFIKENDPLNNSLKDRHMTWTDIFYLAAMETLADKHVIITRYPVSDYMGLFPCKIHVLTTLKTVAVEINGVEYPYYPVVDLNATPEEINTLFIDTITMSNMYLKALGGDYDGDTVSCKMVYTEEANNELEEILNSIRHYFTLEGNLIRQIGNETYLTWYNMSIY